MFPRHPEPGRAPVAFPVVRRPQLSLRPQTVTDSVHVFDSGSLPPYTGGMSAALLDAQEVAELLGFSRRTIYASSWQARVRLRPIRLGRAVRFRREDVERLLGGQREIVD